MLSGSPVITIKNPQGRWARGPNDACPPDHCIDERNLVFDDGQCGSRSGFEPSLAAAGSWDGSIVRVHKYERLGEVLRYLILDSSGNIWDSTNFNTPVLSDGSYVDFACTSLFNRAYISPSTGLVGKTGEKVYVYETSPPARAAAGTGISGKSAMVGADQALGTKVEKGEHLFGIACETASGFITVMGLTASGGLLKYNSPGGEGVDLTNIPLGPSGTNKRHLVATTTLSTDYNENPAEQQWFFVPVSKLFDVGTSNQNDDVLADNVTAACHVDFYDADLIISADYLQYLRTEIPAGSLITHFEGRLIVCGQAASDNIVLVSESGKPEAFSELYGYIIVDPGDMGDGVKNAVEHRGMLYLTKTSRTYVTADNGSTPATWQVNLIDASIGCEALGVSEVLDVRGATKDMFLIAHTSGLYAFIGSYSEDRNLAWKIKDLWATINPLYLKLVQVQVDPINQVIYIAVPLDAATSPSHLLICDYKNGLDPRSVRWSQWDLHVAPTCVWTETVYATQVGAIKFGSAAGDIFVYTSASRSDNSASSKITSYARFGQLSFNEEGAVNHFTAIRIRARGAGSLILTTYDLDDANSTNPTALTLAAGGGVEQDRKINIESPELSIQLGVSATGEWFTMTHLRLAGKPRWSHYPE